MEKIVSNASSLIFIGKIRIFNYVKNLYSKIFVPEEVIKEIFKYDKPENQVIKQEIESGYIEKIKVKEIKDFPLDDGEKDALSLCIEKEIRIFLSDDKNARSYAKSLGINSIGVIGIILKNLKLKKINKAKARELVDKLVKNNLYTTPGLYVEVLRLIEEC